MSWTVEVDPNANKVLVDKLVEVKQVLNDNGWCQGDYRDNRGHYCIYGALQVVDWDYQDKLADVLKQNIKWAKDDPDAGSGLVAWNDAPTRRKRDVIRLIDRTIRNLETAA